MKNIAIIGAGAWGTALAMTTRRAGLETVLWAYEAEVAKTINDDNENPLYLPSIKLDPEIYASTDLAIAADADLVMLVTPAQCLREICTRMKGISNPGQTMIICCKGIEQDSGALMSEVVAETLPNVDIAVLSGPTFAAEVARELPTAVTLATADRDRGRRLANALGSRMFRIYNTTDLPGAQIGGAVKNVLAIACGIVEGRKMGDNARAAIITRGLAEITRLGIAKGGNTETLTGLSGLGDIALTCNAMQSRNFSLGVALGKGKTLDQILGRRKSVAEGVFTATSVTRLARRLGVEMPISNAIESILNHSADIDETIDRLLSRPQRSE